MTTFLVALSTSHALATIVMIGITFTSLIFLPIFESQMQEPPCGICSSVSPAGSSHILTLTAHLHGHRTHLMLINSYLAWATFGNHGAFDRINMCWWWHFWPWPFIPSGFSLRR
jgi:hypothetical protein